MQNEHASTSRYAFLPVVFTCLFFSFHVLTSSYRFLSLFFLILLYFIYFLYYPISLLVFSLRNRILVYKIVEEILLYAE